MDNEWFGKELIVTGEVKWIGDPDEDPKNNPGFQLCEKTLREVEKERAERDKRGLMEKL